MHQRFELRQRKRARPGGELAADRLGGHDPG
jgi:hypothetical protein